MHTGHCTPALSSISAGPRTVNSNSRAPGTHQQHVHGLGFEVTGKGATAARTCVTVIFIFCLGVRSPWRTTVSTHLSSNLRAQTSTRLVSHSRSPTHVLSISRMILCSHMTGWFPADGRPFQTLVFLSFESLQNSRKIPDLVPPCFQPSHLPHIHG